MERIIAGRFGTKAEADLVAHRIFAYVDADDVCIFHNNPPGQHGSAFTTDTIDEADTVSDEAETTSAATAAVAGVVVGAVAVAAGPVAALAAAGVAAYTGSLVGALGGASDADGKAIEEPVQALLRQGGVMLSVRIVNPLDEARVIGDLDAAGARDVERADGEWRDGDWVDFNPHEMPRLVHEKAA